MYSDFEEGVMVGAALAVFVALVILSCEPPKPLKPDPRQFINWGPTCSHRHVLELASDNSDKRGVLVFS